jgi:hypothetical protein
MKDGQRGGKRDGAVMTESTIDGRKLLETIKVEIRWPRAFGFRMWLTRQIIGLAGLVSPIVIDADVRSEREDETDASTWTRYEGDTAEGGKIVLSNYPEGYILRHHGEVVWREWDRKLDAEETPNRENVWDTIEADIARKSMIRKGGVNREPSKVTSRPPAPGPTRNA